MSERIRERHLLTVRPWFADHSVSGTTVLPAVETLLFLGTLARQRFPEFDITTMVEARFKKFLEIRENCSAIEVLVEWEIEADQLCARLQSEVPLKKMTRIKEHGEVRFPLMASDAAVEELCEIGLPATCEKRFSADEIYQHLVPFGPTYRSLQGTLQLGTSEAVGRLRAPLLPSDSSEPPLLGSPFPCDGAMHAACVLGQQRADFIPFPVGFAQRRVLYPTQPGDEYLVKASLIGENPGEMIFDLRIADDSGRLFETIDALSMRNVGLSPIPINS